MTWTAVSPTHMNAIILMGKHFVSVHKKQDGTKDQTRMKSQTRVEQGCIHSPSQTVQLVFVELHSMHVRRVSNLVDVRDVLAFPSTSFSHSHPFVYSSAWYIEREKGKRTTRVVMHSLDSQSEIPAQTSRGGNCKEQMFIYHIYYVKYSWVVTSSDSISEMWICMPTQQYGTTEIRTTARYSSSRQISENSKKKEMHPKRGWESPQSHMSSSNIDRVSRVIFLSRITHSRQVPRSRFKCKNLPPR